jgi:hypothetical protein
MMEMKKRDRSPITGYQNINQTINDNNMSGPHTQDINMMKEMNQNSKVAMIMQSQYRQ